MANVLCIDCEPETAAAIRADGHKVDSGSIGYSSGVVNQPYDPRVYDAVICDLRRPVCYNNELWLSAGQAPASYSERTAPGEAYRRISGRLVPTFQLIRRVHMRVAAGRHFGGEDVLDAVTGFDRQMLLFLNPEWIRHLGEEFPDWVALAWKFQKANARKATPDAALKAVLPEVDLSLPVRLPLREQIVAGPLARSVAEISWDFELLSGFEKRSSGARSRSIIGSQTGQSFGQLVRTNPSGRGAIWALPCFSDNALAARLFVSRLGSLGLE
jgi:hypothetical protein